jgi:hypothetical protein
MFSIFWSSSSICSSFGVSIVSTIVSITVEVPDFIFAFYVWENEGDPMLGEQLGWGECWGTLMLAPFHRAISSCLAAKSRSALGLNLTGSYFLILAGACLAGDRQRSWLLVLGLRQFAKRAKWGLNTYGFKTVSKGRTVLVVAFIYICISNN